MKTAPDVVAACLAILAAVPASAQVAGDECSNALTAVVGANAVNTAIMTPSPNPPYPDKSCPSLGWTPSTRDAWFRYEATTPGRLGLDLCESNFNTSIVVYRGSCSALERIACDDDGCPDSNRSRIEALEIEAGLVWIRVGGSFSAAGQVSMSLTFESLVRPGLYQFGSVESTGSTSLPPGNLGSVAAADAGAVFVLPTGEPNPFYSGSAVALRPNGQVFCWGDNWAGQCNVPEGLGPALAASTSGIHTVALKSDGSVACWGYGWDGQCTVPPGLNSVIAVSAGDYHTVALKSQGSVVCWGANWSGQCNVPDGLGAMTAIAAGGYHTIALGADGSVEGWGGSAAPSGLKAVTAIAAGTGHSVALRADGTVVCWGDDYFGQCSVPPTLGTATAVAAGAYHTVALRVDGSVACWGDNFFGQCSPGRNASPALGVAAGGFTTLILSARDCNGNVIADQAELEEADCDENGVHDCWDAEVGAIEDCNGNSLGDTCEKQVSLDLVSSALSPIGSGHPQSFAIPDAVPAIGPVQIKVTGLGDFNAYTEYVRMTWPGFAYNALRFPPTAPTCVERVDASLWTAPIEPEVFNGGIGLDGTWRVELIPTIAVDPFLCPDGTWIRIELSYLGAAPSDCNLDGRLDGCQIADGTAPDTNGNGVIDTCENPIVACPSDFDADRTTGAADLAVLLASWNTAGTNGTDLNGDGTVSAADLALLLAAWGPCPES